VKAFFSTKEGGTGIGLLLANAALERLGGQVSLLRDPQGGTCTRIDLPARVGMARMMEAMDGSSLLLVDDDATFCRVLGLALKPTRFRGGDRARRRGGVATGAGRSALNTPWWISIWRAIRG
jgi:hypothetical protein